MPTGVYPRNINHICAACDSTKTLIDKRGWQSWHNHDGNWLCQKCYDKWVNHPVWHQYHSKDWNKIHSKRRLRFKETTYMLSENPKKYQCELCGLKVGDTYIDSRDRITTVKITHMHHNEYELDNPLAHTMELCASCHMKISRREAFETSLMPI